MADPTVTETPMIPAADISRFYCDKGKLRNVRKMTEFMRQAWKFQKRPHVDAKIHYLRLEEEFLLEENSPA